MPFYTKEADILPQLAGVESALIVPCRFCPAASLAVRENEPYLEPFRRLLQTGAYDRFVRDLRRRLEERGIRTGVFKVQDAIGSAECRVIQGMAVEGLMNAIPAIGFAFNVSLEVRGKIPVQLDGAEQGLQASR